MSLISRVFWMFLTVTLLMVQLSAQDDYGAVLTSESNMVELRPYLTYYLLEIEEQKDLHPNDLASKTFQPLGTLSQYGTNQHVCLRFSYRTSGAKERPILVSRLVNYANDYEVLFLDTSDTWIRQSYSYDMAIKDRAYPSGEAAHTIPSTSEKRDIFILLKSSAWVTTDWVLYSKDGFERHRSIMSTLLLIYLIVVILFFTVAIIAGILLKLRLALFFAFYILTMGIYILYEANWLSEYIFPNHTHIPFLMTPIIHGILVIASLLYTRELCKTGRLPKLLDRAILFFVGYAVLIMIWGMLDHISTTYLTFSNVLFYAATVIFIGAVTLNLKSHIPMRWILGGLMMMALSGSIIDLHAQGILFAPWAYYGLIPALLCEFILVAIGTVLGAKTERHKLLIATDENMHLRQDMDRLQTEVDHTLSAYEALVNRSASGALNVPKEYYDHPLSAREFQILQLLSLNHTNQGIADELHLSRNTIKTHLKKIYKKIGANSRQEAVTRAKEYGLL